LPIKIVKITEMSREFPYLYQCELLKTDPPVMCEERVRIVDKGAKTVSN